MVVSYEVQRFFFNPASLLTSATVMGLVIALVGTWLLDGNESLRAIGFGTSLAYLAGGVPTGWRALKALWHEHVLDIDLLMIIAALAAAAVGAPSRARSC